MGKRLLRRKAAELLKLRGFNHKLYRGNGKKISARFLHTLISHLTPNPGDIVHDCDGANHVLKSYDIQLASYPSYAHWTRFASKSSVQFAYCDTVKFEDGRYSCGCGFGLEKAVPRHEIEKVFLECERSEYESRILEKSPVNTRYFQMCDIIASGWHVHDENGVLLSKWRP